MRATAESENSDFITPDADELRSADPASSARLEEKSAGQAWSSLVSAGVLSYKAHATTAHSLRLHALSGLTDSAGEFFVHFNAITAGDEVIARKAGVNFSGSYENMGLYGGFRAIAERARHPYALLLENDVIPLEGSNVVQCLNSCVADMIKHGIRIFSLRSRSNPGEGEPWLKYLQCFPVRNPVNPGLRRQNTPMLSQAQMRIRHGHLGKFKGAAIYAEAAPDAAQPQAVRRLPSGNFLTDSRFQNWSSQAVIVERKFFLDVICRRAEEHSGPRPCDGGREIERALNSWWWRRRREPMGHAAQGVFTHFRIDR
jgi:hypothetical protein